MNADNAVSKLAMYLHNDTFLSYCAMTVVARDVTKHSATMLITLVKQTASDQNQAATTKQKGSTLVSLKHSPSWSSGQRKLDVLLCFDYLQWLPGHGRQPG